jgi:hypothetical protein
MGKSFRLLRVLHEKKSEPKTEKGESKTEVGETRTEKGETRRAERRYPYFPHGHS